MEQSEAFPQVLEERLSEAAPEARVEVLNLGTGGYNPYTEAALLRDVGVSYEPDLVLVQFAINDLNDPTLHFDAQSRLHLSAVPDAAYPDPSVRRAPPEPPSAALQLCRRLRTCALLDDWWLASTQPDPEEAEEADRLAAVAPIEGGSGPEWDWLEALYAQMAAEAERVGAGFAVLVFPYRAQLAGTGSHPVQERLAEMGRRRGWPTLDPLPAFRSAAADGEGPLFLDWWHPTPAGHALTAREILSELACGDSLPGRARELCPSDTRRE